MDGIDSSSLLLGGTYETTRLGMSCSFSEGGMDKADKAFDQCEIYIVPDAS